MSFSESFGALSVLPLELRQTIYLETLRQWNPRVCPSIMSVSRAVFNEVSSVLYEKSTLKIHLYESWPGEWPLVDMYHPDLGSLQLGVWTERSCTTLFPWYRCKHTIIEVDVPAEDSPISHAANWTRSIAYFLQDTIKKQPLNANPHPITLRFLEPDPDEESWSDRVPAQEEWYTESEWPTDMDTIFQAAEGLIRNPRFDVFIEAADSAVAMLPITLEKAFVGFKYANYEIYGRNPHCGLVIWWEGLATFYMLLRRSFF